MKYTILLTITLILFSALAFSQDFSGDFKQITIKQNENLSVLADKYLKSKRFTSDLLRYNRLTEKLIRPGLSIKIPYDISKERVAKVKFLRGNALRTNGKAWHYIRRSGLVLLQDEKVKTGAKSQLELQFDDGSLIQLAEKSSISLKDFRYGRKGRVANITLKSGSLFANVNKLRRKSEFKISTISAVVGVRGTQFHVSVKNNNTVRVEVYKGLVEVKGKKGQAIQVKTGYKTTIKNGFAPDTPTKITSRRKINWAR